MVTDRAVLAFSGALMPYGEAPAGELQKFAYQPVFDSVTPSGSGHIYTSHTVTVPATYHDPAGGTGIHTSAITVRLDGKGHTSSASISSSKLSITFTGLANGTHSVVITIADKAGNTRTVTRSFYVRP